MSKTKLIVSVFDWSPPSDKEQKPVSYKVHRVTGTTQFWPGQILTREKVSDLCDMTGMFEVTIVPNDD